MFALKMMVEEDVLKHILDDKTHKTASRWMKKGNEDKAESLRDEGSSRAGELRNPMSVVESLEGAAIIAVKRVTRRTSAG
ncbi:hypothetical protein PVK06_027074 [Gossypium arboreum]|uniref:Uncharacterized protein n=1 Tax=Gossypium arboreum TaxID=29729 RepID=A0ABR0NZN5_GOSAR|nr:hypothetical protein PVK06_027074 [Gossypium arboreum]